MAGPEHETNPENDPTLHFLTTNYSRPHTSTRAVYQMLVNPLEVLFVSMGIDYMV